MGNLDEIPVRYAIMLDLGVTASLRPFEVLGIGPSAGVGEEFGVLMEGSQILAGVIAQGFIMVPATTGRTVTVTSTTENPIYPGMTYRIFVAFGDPVFEWYYVGSQVTKTFSTKGIKLEWFSGDPLIAVQLSEEGGVGFNSPRIDVAAEVFVSLTSPPANNASVELRFDTSPEQLEQIRFCFGTMAVCMGTNFFDVYTPLLNGTGSALPPPITIRNGETKTFFLAAVNDNMLEGLHYTTLRFSVQSGGDPDYNNLALPDIQITIEDDEDTTDPFLLADAVKGEVHNLKEDITYNVTEGNALSFDLFVDFEIPQGESITVTFSSTDLGNEFFVLDGVEGNKISEVILMGAQSAIFAIAPIDDDLPKPGRNTTLDLQIFSTLHALADVQTHVLRIYIEEDDVPVLMFISPVQLPQYMSGNDSISAFDPTSVTASDMYISVTEARTGQSPITTSFGVFLSAIPSKSVTIRFIQTVVARSNSFQDANGEAVELMVDPPAITFTSTNAEEFRVITVWGVTDGIRDGEALVALTPEVITDDSLFENMEKPIRIKVFVADADVCAATVVDACPCKCCITEDNALPKLSHKNTKYDSAKLSLTIH
ncbi:hypothetical protein BSKO_14008 [Bryopsis sp. KO-2023]|nr:hypothetical protein BSKO_14008 [Bryopsis sp. KO-2023]